MTEKIESTAGPLELRVMGDPCPRCGGTDYYCAEEADRHLAHLQAEVERRRDQVHELQAEGTRRLQALLGETRQQLADIRAQKWVVEHENAQLRNALEWIDDHDQTRRPNGGDPEWFAEQAPIRARKALYGEQ